MRRLMCALLLVPMFLPTNSHPAAADSQHLLIVEPDDGVTPLVKFIESAQHSIDGEDYLLSSKPVIAALEDAAGRGVTVRINLEQHPEGTAASQPQQVFRTLAAHHVQMRWTSSTFTYTHAKYLVVDQKVAWIGTMNWTTSSFTGNREFAVVDTVPRVVAEAEQVFSADWTHATYTGSADVLVLSPVNSRQSIEAIIKVAKHTLDIYAEELDDPAVSAAITAAVQRGVRVRLITTTDDAIGALAHTIPVVVRKSSPYIHAKVIIADSTYIYIGSENYSSTSLDKNREMGLLLKDQDVIRGVEAAFTHDLAGAGGGSGGSTALISTPVIGANSRGSGSPPVSVSVSPNPTSYGTSTTITARTSSGASCTVQVTYASGSTSGSSDLKTAQTATSSGTVSWTWKFGSRTVGTGHAKVICSQGSQSHSGTASFTVQ